MLLHCVCQMDELRRTQEAERQEQEVTHRKEMESLRQQYETSIEGEDKTPLKTDLILKCFYYYNVYNQTCYTHTYNKQHGGHGNKLFKQQHHNIK